MAIGRSSVGVLATNLLNLLLAVGNSIFLTRTLGVVGKGEFAVFTASVGLLSLMLGIGTDTSLRYFVARDRVERERVLLSLVCLALLATGLVFGGTRLNHVLFDNTLLLPDGRQTLALELTLAGVVGATLFNANLSSVFAGHRRFAVLNLLSIAFALVSLATWFTLFQVDRTGRLAVGTGTVLVAYLGLTLANSVALAALAWRWLDVRFAWKLVDPHLVGEMVRYAGKAFAAQVAQFLNYRVDIWIVQAITGVAALGLYSLASNIAMMLWVLPRSVSRVLMPSVAAGDEGTSPGDVARITRLALLVTAVVGGGAGATAGWWVPLLYGSEFSGSVRAFGILLVGTVPFSLSVILGATLSGMNRLEENLAASLAGLLVTVALDLALIPVWGIAGAAAASATSYLVTTAVVVRAYSRIVGIPVQVLVIPRRNDLAYVIHGLQKLLR